MGEIVKFVSYFVCECLLINQSHLFLLSFLGSILLWFVFRGKKTTPKLSKEEEEDVIKQFDPDPLIGSDSTEIIGKQRIVQSRVGKYVNVDGEQCLNFASHNYLGFVDDAEVTKRTTECISKYGVGSCGPRGFYGTADVHMELEEKLAEFMGVEEACVYSYGFSTAASAIPAYCKRRDIIFADEQVNFAIQKGIDASRSEVKFFKHNDTKHLEQLLEELELAEMKAKKKSRKFLVIEGIYLKTGTICPLPELVRLRSHYQMRLFLDETVSIGTLGETGRGVVEYFGVPSEEVDLRVGSMEGALASVGGFCCGSSFIVEHQRLSGLGYCFSAALPPLLAVAALTSLEQLRNDPFRVQKLNDISKKLQSCLSILPNLTLSGHELSPIKHLHLAESHGYAEDMKVLQRVADECFSRGLAVLPPSCLPVAEKIIPLASLRVVANALLEDSDIDRLSDALQDISSRLLEL